MNPTFAWVAVVYAAFVLLMRRYDDRLRVGAATLFYLLVSLFLFEAMFGQSIDLPADFLGRLAPWDSVLPEEQPVNGALNDIVLQLVPWAHEVREAWKSGEFPLWNESVGGGYPLLANAQSSALSPVRILSLPLELGHSFAAEAAFKLLIALTFAYLWARRREMSETASIVTAICFGFSMGIQAWLHFPLATTAAMLPAIFYAIDRLVLDERRSGVALVSIVFAITLLSGHPEMAAHAIAFGGFWFLFVLLTERRRQWKSNIARISLACVFALLLAAPFLLPFLEAVPRSLRMAAIGDVLDLTAPNRSPELFALILHGSFFGRVGHQVWGPVHPEFASTFAGMIAVAGFVAILACLIATRRRSSPLMFFAVAVPLTIMGIFSVPPVSTLLEVIPPFSFAANSRLRIVLCWLLAVCAGALIDLIRQRKPRFALLGLGFVAAALLIAFTRWSVFGDAVKQEAIFTALPGVLSIVAVFALLGPRWMSRAAPAAIIALVVADLWLPSRGFNPELPENYLYPPTPLTQRLQTLIANDPLGPVRFTAIGSVLFPNSASIYGLQDIRAHDPMANARTLGFMRVFLGYDPDNYFATIRRVDHPFLDFMNVRYVVTREPIEIRGFNEVYSGPDGKIYQNEEAMPRFSTAEEIVVVSNRDELNSALLDPNAWHGKVVIEQKLEGVLLDPGQEIDVNRKRSGSYRLWLNSPEPRLIVTSLPWWPGWRVRSKGVTLEPLRINGGFLGFVSPTGPSRIKLTYRPLSFRIGASLFLIAVIGLIVYQRRGRTRGTGGVSSPPPRTLLFILLLALFTTGCEQQNDLHFPVYPGAVQRPRIARIFVNAHEILNRDDPREIDLMVLDSAASVEEVAEWYAKLYGFEVSQDQVNDFSPMPPRAYLLEGNLRNDFEGIKPLLAKMGIEPEVQGVEGMYQGAHVDAVYGRPRVSIQRPYVDPVREKLVDRTLILLVHD